MIKKGDVIELKGRVEVVDIGRSSATFARRSQTRASTKYVASVGRGHKLTAKTKIPKGIRLQVTGVSPRNKPTGFKFLGTL